MGCTRRGAVDVIAVFNTTDVVVGPSAKPVWSSIEAGTVCFDPIELFQNGGVSPTGKKREQLGEQGTEKEQGGDYFQYRTEVHDWLWRQTGRKKARGSERRKMESKSEQK